MGGGGGGVATNSTDSCRDLGFSVAPVDMK